VVQAKGNKNTLYKSVYKRTRIARAKNEVAKGENPPTFNLVCAVHHVCGAVSVCYESNECVIDEPGKHLTHAQIVRMHMILFAECFAFAAEKENKK
jgi:hypothetical protein